VVQVLPGGDGVEAEAEPVQRGDDGGRHRGEAQGVAAQGGTLQVVGRLEVLGRGDGGEHGAEAVEGPVAAGASRHLPQQRSQVVRQGPDRADLGLEGPPAGGVGQLAVHQQRPHVLEGALLGEVDGGVLAVVEEALGAAHVADARVGDHDALEPAGRVDRGFAGRADRRHLHQVAHRQDADEGVALDHGDVAVAATGEGVEGDVDRHRRVDGVGGGGHPLADGGPPGVDAGGGGTDEVALGEDADGQPGLADHHDRPDAGEDHGIGGGGDGLRGGGGDDRRAHELADQDRAGRPGTGGGDGVHGSTLTPVPTLINLDP
jgi:hypothetical protein